MFYAVFAYLMGICACLHFTLMLTVVNFSLVALFMILPFTSYWYIPLLYLCWYFYDRKTPFKGGRRFPWFRQLRMWKYLAQYFPIKLHKTVDLDPSKNYIFGFHPHGIFVFGSINFSTNGTGFDELFPGIKMHMLVLNGQFKFPVYRDYLIAAGFGSANAESVDYKLTKLGGGNSVWLAIGGAAEVLLFDHNTYTLRINDRKGFVRRALKTGALVVPCFSFGETRAYLATMPEKNSALYYVQKAVKSISNLTLPIDVRGSSWCWFLLPRRVPINTVVGAPVDFTDAKERFKDEKELIDHCHKMYLDALRKLYDDNKAKFGDENIPLIFT